MKHPIATLVAAAALALTGIAADAQQYATTSKPVNLRAGPGRDYPVVAVLPPQMQVMVYGCISSYSWCDVAAGPDRGWVYAGNLLYFYDNREVLLPSVAAVIGIGIASFIIDDYWHEHYVDRWWWPQRQRWYRHAPPPPIREHAYPRPGPGPHPGPRPGPQPGPGQWTPGEARPHVEGSPQDWSHEMPPNLQQPGRPVPHQQVQPAPRPQVQPAPRPQVQPAPQPQQRATPAERRQEHQERREERREERQDRQDGR